MSSDLKERIVRLVSDKRTHIPTLPVVVTHILRAAGDDTASTKDLAELIGRDQGISNRILRLANSAYYGRTKEIDTLTRAILLIGFSEVVSLSIGMSVFSSVQQLGTGGLLSMSELWLHSTTCYFASKQIVVRMETNKSGREAPLFGRRPELAVYLSALLHDMGKVIFSVYFAGEYKAVLDSVREREISLDQQEKELLGIDHATVAALLMNRWNFPESVMIPIRFHHNPLACRSDHECNAIIVSLANFMAQSAGMGFSGNPVARFQRSAARELGMSDNDIAHIAKELKKDVPQIRSFLACMS